MPKLRINPKTATVFCALVLGIFSQVSSTYASAELDRLFRLQKIGILKPWDNVDGLFSDLVSEGVSEALSKESRFLVTDLRKSSQLLAQSKTSYLNLIEEKEVLLQIAKTQGLDALIRSKVVKEGPIYRFQLDWIFGKTAQVLASEQFQVNDPFLATESPSGTLASSVNSAGSESFQRALSVAMIRLVTQIPFRGMVTGRDANAITVDIGSRSNLRKGDRLIIGTLEELKEHPLLRKIVDWRFVTTGKVTITEVDDGMAFGKIEVEEVGRTMARYQKILQIVAAPEESPIVETHKVDVEDRRLSVESPPRLGYFSPGLFLGSYSRDASLGNGSESFSGSAKAFGFQAEGQIWFTSRWFSELSFAYATGGFSQTNETTHVTTSPSVDSKMSHFRIGFGYFFPFSEEFFGPKAFLRMSYQSTSFELPSSSTDKTSATKFSGLLFGLGGDLPFRGNYGSALALDFGPFSGATEGGSYYGTTSGAIEAAFRLGGYYWLQPKLKLQVNLDFKSASVNFVNGSTLSNKILSIGPSLLLYF